MEQVIVCEAPRTDRFMGKDWHSLRDTLSRRGLTWHNGVFDLQDPTRIWLIDAHGRASHYLQKLAAIPSGFCSRCGSPGKLVRTALVCEAHGPFGGI